MLEGKFRKRCSESLTPLLFLYRFIGGNKSRHGAYEMARLALDA